MADNACGTKETIQYDFLTVVPPQSALDWLKATPLADPASTCAPDHPADRHHDMWLLKRYGLPFLYWNLMLKGRA